MYSNTDTQIQLRNLHHAVECMPTTKKYIIRVIHSRPKLHVYFLHLSSMVESNYGTTYVIQVLIAAKRTLQTQLTLHTNALNKTIALSNVFATFD